MAVNYVVIRGEAVHKFLQIKTASTINSNGPIVDGDSIIIGLIVKFDVHVCN